MPQAAIAAIGAYLAGAIAASGLVWYVQVFLYVATSYLLQRASVALTPRRRAPGLSAASGVNVYDGAGRSLDGVVYAR